MFHFPRGVGLVVLNVEIGLGHDGGELVGRATKENTSKRSEDAIKNQVV